MSDKGNYVYPAWCQMETALDSYEQDRATILEREATSLGPDGKERWHELTKAAEALVEGVQQLTGVDGLSTLEEFVKLSDFHQDKPFELLDEHVCLTFAWEVMGMLSSARSRFLELLLVLKERQPCDRAKAFLQRVARCYLFGFDAECVVMCRAVLDREFGEAMSGECHVSDCWKLYVATPHGEKHKGKRPSDVPLATKIEAAYIGKMIGDEDRHAADDVRKRGNKAIHERPDMRIPLDAIRKTVQVLDALEKARIKRQHE